MTRDCIYKGDDTHCTVIDIYGNVLNSIAREHSIGDFGFENGLVYIENAQGQPDIDGKTPDLDPAYYLPDGPLAFQEPNTKMPRYIRLSGT